MTQHSFASALAAGALALLAAPITGQSLGGAAPTFNKDVLPILQSAH